MASSDGTDRCGKALCLLLPLLALLSISSFPISMIAAYNDIDKYDAATCAGGTHLKNQRVFKYNFGPACKARVDTHPVFPNGTINANVTVRLRFPVLPRLGTQSKRGHGQRECKSFLRRLRSKQTFRCFVEDAQAAPGARMEGYTNKPIVAGWYVFLVILILVVVWYIYYVCCGVWRRRHGSASITSDADGDGHPGSAGLIDKDDAGVTFVSQPPVAYLSEPESTLTD